MVGENPNPEPGAWRRVSILAGSELGVAVIPEMTPLVPASLNPFKIAHLTGTTRFSLSAEQRAEIKSFVERGGTMVVDAAGGNADFADSAETELAVIFGPAVRRALLEPLPMSHAVYSSKVKIEQVSYTRYSRQYLTGNAHDARLVGIPSPKDANRIAVFYSRQDITAGCLGRSIGGIIGYDAETATNLMINMIAYAADRH